ncbi:hypothetical protein GQ457_17G007830 [Hibiscus cannabinus]
MQNKRKMEERAILEEEKVAERPRPFKWFSHWAQNSGYVEFVKATVAEGVGKGVGELLKKIKGATKEWAKRQKAKEVESIADAEKRIEKLECSTLTLPTNSEINKQIRELRSSIWERYRKDEREWLQKSRLKWFKEGDKNTRFFHLTASRRRNANFITSIESENGEIVDLKQIELAFVKYFKDNFNGSNTIPVRHFGVQLKALSHTSRSLLQSRFSVREDEIMKLFDDFYTGKITEKSLNHSFIALIPKVKSPTRLEDYRPISLVSSLYKIIARVLSRRLAGCLAEVVGENQFAFTAGKQITYCNLIANEVIDDIKKNNRAAVVFKADFSKAYDMVDWKFLELIMEKMGFGKRWRKWIRLCISTPSISVLVNGVPSKKFNIKRGLRQGCPLSPLLFNLVGEALSALLHKALEAGVLKGVQVGKSNLKFSHIQFADDLILFGDAKEEEVLNMKRWAERVRCSCDSFPTVYLGLPLGVMHNSKEIWDPVLQAFQKRLDGWKGKILSLGGRITLAKSVLSSLPIYYLSMFQLPACTAAKLNSLISNFIWGNKEGRAIHWVKWEIICKPKIRGGLGLWDLRLKNRALLNKWLWRYGEEKESLWRKVVDAKYGYDSKNLIPEVREGKRGSWLWKNITSPLLNREDLFTKHIRFGIGNGEYIDFWGDFWTEVPSLKVAFPRIFALALKKRGKVNEFGVLGNNGWEWKIELRRVLFDWEYNIWEEFLSILNKAVCGSRMFDRIRWVGNSNGTYSTRAFCEVSSETGVDEVNIWKEIWVNLAPPKVEAFIWKVMHQRIPTKVELAKRGVTWNGDLNCPVCGSEPESAIGVVLSGLRFVCRLWILLDALLR